MPFLPYLASATYHQEDGATSCCCKRESPQIIRTNQIKIVADFQVKSI